MKKIITICICCFLCCVAFAQQDPIQSLYLQNRFAINPAYAGLNDFLQAQVSYRTQWAGIEGNPRTLNFSGHTSIYNNKGGIGIQVTEDRIGENKNTEIQAAFSYKVQLSGSTLAFGMQAGVINFANDPSELSIQDPGDPNFASYSEFSFNTGAGLLLRSERYFIGISAPRLLPNTIRGKDMEINFQNQALYLNGAYMFILSERVRFKPSVLVRGMKNNPVSTDFQANFSFSDSYTAGVFTRNLKTYGILANFQIKKVQLGYVFELPTNNSSGLQFASHQVALSIKTSVFRFHDFTAVNNF
jgi:type IX secretion system PorP/SprF family membrane protein